MKVVGKILWWIVKIWIWFWGIGITILLGLGLLGAKSLGKTPSDYFDDVGNDKTVEDTMTTTYALHGIDRLSKMFKKK